MRDSYGGTRFRGALILPTITPAAADLQNGANWLDVSTNPDRFMVRADGVSVDAFQPPLIAPIDQGYKAWMGDPTDFNAVALVETSGTMYIFRIPVPRSITITIFEYSINGAGATLTAGRNEVGLYDSAGNKLTGANQDANGITTGLKTVTLASTTLAGGTAAFVYAAMMFTGSTMPAIWRKALPSAITINANITSTAAGYRIGSAVIASGGLPATLPAMSVGFGFLPWIGLR